MARGMTSYTKAQRAPPRTAVSIQGGARPPRLGTCTTEIAPFAVSVDGGM